MPGSRIPVLTVEYIEEYKQTNYTYNCCDTDHLASAPADHTALFEQVLSAESYRSQIELYSRALEGATGKTVKEAYLYLFDTGQFVAM